MRESDWRFVDARENDTVLVDPYGKAISSMPQSRWKAILSKNLWNILGPGLAAVITVAGIVEMIFVKSYVISCANFYGIDKKYFSGTEIAGDKVIFLVCSTGDLESLFSGVYKCKGEEQTLYHPDIFGDGPHPVYAESDLHGSGPGACHGCGAERRFQSLHNVRPFSVVRYRDRLFCDPEK